MLFRFERTHQALAKQEGIFPTVLTKLIHLTRLAPEIQEHIRTMPATARAGPITLGRMVPLARSPDHRYQLEEFRKLLLRPAKIRKPRTSEALSRKVKDLKPAA